MSIQRTTDADGTGSAESDARDGTRISKDDAFHVLQNARRRAVLRYMAERDEEAYRMRDVAEAVAAWEHDTTVRQLASEERQRVYIALYQSHLPKLDDHGVIEYDQSRGIVRPTELASVFEPYLADGLEVESDVLTAGSAEPESTPGLASAVSGLFGT